MKLPCTSVVTVAVVLATVHPLAAQTAEPEPAIEVVPFVRDVTGLERWSFFEPRIPADSDYTLLSNRATLGVRVNTARLQAQGAFQYAIVVGLPRRAMGPGPLGPGAMYFDAAHAPYTFQLYFKALSLRVKDVWPGMSIEAGRMGFRSGRESVSAAPEIATIKQERLDGLIIGEAEWTTFERAFDGIRVDVDRPGWHATAGLLWPTQGVFEESANPTIDKVRMGTAAITITSTQPREAQLFATHYRDTRDVIGRPDNTGRESAAADVSVWNLGASHVGVFTAGSGRVDTLLWASSQIGDWYGDTHRAFSVRGEGGYQWRARWRPRVGGGLNYASGDEDSTDSRHGTFFPMLPSTRPDLLAGTFAQMNLRDVFANLRIEPHPRMTVRADVHRLALADANDHWLSGTGATARRGEFFGFVSRRSSGASGLGTFVQLAAEGAVSRFWTVTGSLGFVRGGDVVHGLFAGDLLTVVSVRSMVVF